MPGKVIFAQPLLSGWKRECKTEKLRLDPAAPSWGELDRRGPGQATKGL